MLGLGFTVSEPQAGEVEYEGRLIVFDERADPPELTIDGVKITYFSTLTSPNGKRRYYAASAITYMEFSTLLGLAKALIDAGQIEFAPGKSPD